MESSSRRTSRSSKAEPSQAITWMVLLSVATLLCVTILHWGGMYHHVALWLYPVGGLLWLCVGFRAWKAQHTRERFGGWVEAALLLFLAYATWSFSLSPAKYVARFEFLWILTYAGAFLGLRLTLHNRRWGIWLVALLLGLASLTCVFALMNKGVSQYLIWGLPRPDYGDRISGTFGCPNHFANLMAMACCLSVAYFIYPRTPWALRILSLYLLAMFSVGVFFSVSRGGYIAWLSGLFVISCFFILQRSFPLKLRLVLLTSCLLVAALFSYMAFQNPFVKSRIDATWKGDIRLHLAADAIKIWKENPLLGSGMATFDFEHQRIHSGYLSSRAVYTHDDYLNLLADYGAVGAILVLLFFIVLTPELWRRHAESEREFDLLMTRSAIWILVVMAAHSLFDFNFHIPACALTFFCILGLATSRSARPGSNDKAGFLPGLILGLVALLAAGYLIHSAYAMRDSVVLEKWKEEDYLKLSTQQLVELGEKAWRQDPYCSPVLEKIGDGLRVKTAEINQSLKQSIRAGEKDQVEKLLVERENLGKTAQKFYQRAADLNPLYDGMLIKQGLLSDILDRDQEAYLFYSKALQNQPYSNFYHYHLGFHFLKVGEYDMAKEEFALARRIPVHRNLDKDQKQAAEKALKILEELEKTGP
jgi:O-antigen ligase